MVGIDVRGPKVATLHHDHRAARHDVRRRSRQARPSRQILLPRVAEADLEVLHPRRRIGERELHGLVFLPASGVRTKHRPQQGRASRPGEPPLVRIGRAVAPRPPLVRIVQLHARILHVGRDMELQRARFRCGEVESAIDAVRPFSQMPDLKAPLRLIAVTQALPLNGGRTGYRAPRRGNAGEVHQTLPRTRPHPLLKEIRERICFRSVHHARCRHRENKDAVFHGGSPDRCCL